MDTAPNIVSFSDMATFIRQFCGCHNSTISADTRLEADLGVTGDDGDELLQAVAMHFNAALASSDGYRSTFHLREDEYLFHSEGFDPIGLGAIIGRTFGRPRPVIRDLTVGQLYDAICRTQIQPNPSFERTR